MLEFFFFSCRPSSCNGRATNRGWIADRAGRKPLLFLREYSLGLTVDATAGSGDFQQQFDCVGNNSEISLPLLQSVRSFFL